jgi:hypothetical protein
MILCQREEHRFFLAEDRFWEARVTEGLKKAVTFCGIYGALTLAVELLQNIKNTRFNT